MWGSKENFCCSFGLESTVACLHAAGHDPKREDKSEVPSLNGGERVRG